jgi:hypothetical protein
MENEHVECIGHKHVPYVHIDPFVQMTKILILARLKTSAKNYKSPV